MERGMSPRDGVLGIAAMRSLDLVEGGYAVAGLELGHVGADLLHRAGDIIALVDVVADPFGHLPVLRVTAADDYLDEHLVGVGFRDGRVHDMDLRPCSMCLVSTVRRRGYWSNEKQIYFQYLC